MEELFLFYHIPRTGGTALQHHIGHFYDRNNNNWLSHYCLNDLQQKQDYLRNNIPIMSNRFNEQLDALKIITGHAVFANAHKIVNRKNILPRHFTIIREPIERLLSSFNFRHQKHQLNQYDRIFSDVYPMMTDVSRKECRIAKNYKTLYEYLCDCPGDINLQSKWLVKCYYNFDSKKFVPHSNFSKTIDELNFPITWPDWFNKQTKDLKDLGNIAIDILEKIWWVWDFDNYKRNVKDLCEYAGLDYHESIKNKNATGDIVPKYWTINDVKNQPDYDLLIESLSEDYKLYNYVKNNDERPF